MMLRILLLALTLSVTAALFWRRYRSNPLLKVPARIRRLARGHASLSQALKMRSAMIKLALQSDAADAEPLAADVDALLASMAAMCEVQVGIRAQSALHDPNSERARQLRNQVADIDTAVREALDQLHALQMHLVKVTSAEIDAAVVDIRQRLAARKRDLAYVLEGQREVETMLAEGSDASSKAD